jgi:hypothetical protein
LFALLRGYTEKRNSFQSKGRVIHCANGMLELSAEGATLYQFSPEYYSRNPSPFSWDPAVECPRFRNILLKSALDADDISLIQRWFGAILLGGNFAQRIMLISVRQQAENRHWLESWKPLLARETSANYVLTSWQKDSRHRDSLGRPCSQAKTCPAIFFTQGVRMCSRRLSATIS